MEVKFILPITIILLLAGGKVDSKGEGISHSKQQTQPKKQIMKSTNGAKASQTRRQSAKQQLIPTELPELGNITGLGCYTTFLVTNRQQLFSQIGTKRKKVASAEECVVYCNNNDYRLAGIINGGVCKCRNSSLDDSWKRKGCKKMCKKDKKPCGGNGKISVYASVKASEEPTKPALTPQLTTQRKTPTEKSGKTSAKWTTMSITSAVEKASPGVTSIFPSTITTAATTTTTTTITATTTATAATTTSTAATLSTTRATTTTTAATTTTTTTPRATQSDITTASNHNTSELHIAEVSTLATENISAPRNDSGLTKQIEQVVDDGPNLGLYIGSGVGGVVACAIIIAVSVIICLRRKTSASQAQTSNPTNKYNNPAYTSDSKDDIEETTPRLSYGEEDYAQINKPKESTNHVTLPTTTSEVEKPDTVIYENSADDMESSVYYSPMCHTSSDDRSDELVYSLAEPIEDDLVVEENELYGT